MFLLLFHTWVFSSLLDCKEFDNKDCFKTLIIAIIIEFLFRHFYVIIHLIVTTISLGSYLHYSCFTDEKTIAPILTDLHKFTGAGTGARV